MAEAYAIGYAINRARREKKRKHDSALAMVLAAIEAGKQLPQRRRAA